jgi:hypothetical protein
MKNTTFTNSKKILLSSFAAILAFSFTPAETKASTAPVKTELTSDSVTMVNRLEEIRTMDRSNMSRQEKKELRTEVKGIQKKMHDGYGGVYISLGALIIIILLLIIIF